MHVGSWNCTDMGKWWEVEWLAVRNICVPCNDGYKVHMIADLCKGLQFTILYAVKNGPFEHPIVNDSVVCKYIIEQTSIAVAKAQLQKILFSKNIFDHISTSISICLLMGKFPIHWNSHPAYIDQVMSWKPESICLFIEKVGLYRNQFYPFSCVPYQFV